MRIATAAIILLGSVAIVSAQPAAKPPAAGAAVAKQTYDIPMNGKPQTFHMLSRVFKPGEDIGMHTHDGVEISWVVRGTIRLAVLGGESKIFHAGEIFLVPSGTVHDPINVGTEDEEVAVNYVLDNGSPHAQSNECSLAQVCAHPGKILQSLKSPSKAKGPGSPIRGFCSFRRRGVGRQLLVIIEVVFRLVAARERSPGEALEIGQGGIAEPDRIAVLHDEILLQRRDSARPSAVPLSPSQVFCIVSTPAMPWLY